MYWITVMREQNKDPPQLFSKLVLTWCIVLYVYALLIYATYNSTAVLLGQDTLVKEIQS